MRHLLLPIVALGAIARVHASPPLDTWRLHYVALDVAVRGSDRSIAGSVRLTLSPPADKQLPVILDLTDSATVDSVVGRRGTGSLTFSRQAGRIRIVATEARRSCASTSLCDITVWYHVTPSRSAFGIVDKGDGHLRAGSYGVPNSAREWWPTLDDPQQKADSADVRVTVPNGAIAVSNGVLRRKTQNADGTSTFTWAERRPIYADIISLAIADYVQRDTTFRSISGTRVPLTFFEFPEDTAKADADFKVVPSILSFLEKRLGEYPFANEKYGIAEFARPSFREHQTIPSLGASLITGDGTNDDVIAHEAAHQWFGNSVTVSSWHDIWLNESFAEYMSWQWVRATRGDSAFRAHWQPAVEHDYPLALARADSGGTRTMFGMLTFHKGPVVLLMLEDAIGEQAMSAALRAYVHRNAYGHASLDGFQREAEAAAHRKLGWFFDQWVRRTETPTISRFDWAYAAAQSGSPSIRVSISQTEAGEPFRLPLTLSIVDQSGAERRVRVELTQRDQTFSIPAAKAPASVTLVTDGMLIHMAAAPH